MKGTHLDKIRLDSISAREDQPLMEQEVNRKVPMLLELQSKARQYEQELQGMELWVSEKYFLKKGVALKMPTNFISFSNGLTCMTCKKLIPTKTFLVMAILNFSKKHGL